MGKLTTEKQWRAMKVVAPLLYHISETNRGSPRKFRLFACACCRRSWEHIPDARLRAAVELAERMADGAKPAKRVANAAWSEVRGICIERFLEFDHEMRRAFICFYNRGRPAALRWAIAAATACDPDAEQAAGTAEGVANVKELAAGCDLFRDIFGNPFRPVTFDPAWRTDTAVALAQQMYESREFSAMPILADALQDAGCDSDDVLKHCRDKKQVHSRGCWVVDHVLKKK